MCQGLLPSRRHIEKREDPGDEVDNQQVRTSSMTSSGPSSGPGSGALLGSVSSRDCLDAPAILATFTAGRMGLAIV